MELDGKATAILIGVWATFALDVYSSLNSSPQTTEINARARAATLMKWVNIGAIVALSGGVIATVVSRSPWPLIGVAGTVAMMHLFYLNAKRSGLSSPLPGTEDTEDVNPFWRPS